MGKKVGSWRLPSKEILDKIFIYKDRLGGFTDGYYWGDSNSGSLHASAQNFDNGFQSIQNKNNHFSVRLVRVLLPGHKKKKRVITVGFYEYQVAKKDIRDKMDWYMSTILWG